LTELVLRTPARPLVDLDEEYTIELVTRAQAGEIAAFTALYDLYAPRLYRYLAARLVQPADVEDVLQLVFIKVIDSIGRYRPRGSTPFAAWLFRVAHNAMVDELRSRPRDAAVEMTDPVPTGREADPADLVERELQRAQIRSALDELTAEQRDVVLFRFFAGLSARETSAIMGKREGTVRALQFRALSTLRRRLTSPT
jgi:RNA polymerase sigma-70 factor (ECF subfamily)